MATPYPPPPWALKIAEPGDREAALRAHGHGRLKANWDFNPQLTTLNYAGRPRIEGPPRAWAKAHGWPTPWFFFASKFLATMLASDENFDLALMETDVELYFPVEEYVLPPEELARLDRMYAAREDLGELGRRPSEWGHLVEDLREIRRAVEAGVVVQVEGKSLQSFDSFYTWAHDRYHALEDGYDSWIGDDDS